MASLGAASRRIRPDGIGADLATFIGFAVLGIEIKIIAAIFWLWRWVTRADSRAATKAALVSSEEKLARVEDDWRRVRDVLGADVDRGLTGRRFDAP